MSGHLFQRGRGPGRQAGRLPQEEEEEEAAAAAEGPLGQATLPLFSLGDAMTLPQAEGGFQSRFTSLQKEDFPDKKDGELCQAGGQGALLGTSHPSPPHSSRRQAGPGMAL